MLESDLDDDTISKLNIIFALTTDDNLIPWYVFTLAYLTSVTGNCGWDTVVTVGAFPRVPSCAGVVCDSVGATRANFGTLLVHC